MGNTCKILAIQGSNRNSGKTTTMLKYAAKKAENWGIILPILICLKRTLSIAEAVGSVWRLQSVSIIMMTCRRLQGL